ncbi:amidohydrolase family protein [Nitrospirillum sp. BR 11164]|uniref:amidohydrolase family protein n=1 Tax=Nitrospirillum sp. BR 11164 TaxID=3104324 RepID=UPI002AFFF020|nr:amidohydrolase family protein [Nitrospirillum sp. BR 11164]MEA1648101.1 amidohydrolase family protein [Nitrospirillum sp. BR 11164]
MQSGRRDFLKLGGGTLALLALPHPLVAATAANPPIIDVHLHAYPASMRFENPIVNPITGAKSPIKTGADHLTACLAEMTRLNVVRGVVSGGDGDRLQAAVDWRDRDAGRILVGAGIRGSADTPLPPLKDLRKLHAQGKLQVLGELTSQYAGLPLSDPQYDPYLSLAEELDIPVALHTGTMPEGTTFDPCCRTARARFGNPEYVEEALNKHPKLRLNLMHCGWPYLEDTMAMLMLYPNVYADTGAIDWLLPRPAFNDYLKALVDAGFGKRIMFGTDQMYWPDAIGLAVDRIKSAPFLTEEQRRDIFYNNAVRFYKLG